MALHHAGTTDGEWIYRELQRQNAGRVLEPKHLLVLARSSTPGRRMASGLQSRAPAQQPEIPDAHGVSQAARGCRRQTLDGRSVSLLPPATARATFKKDSTCRWHIIGEQVNGSQYPICQQK